MATIFTKIIKGEIPCYKIAEDEHNLAFLDVKPLKRGHALVIPKRETDYIFDIADDEFLKLHLFAKKIAQAIRKAVPCRRIGLAVVGLEVPHAHIHLIPLDQMDDTNFARPRLELSADEFNRIASDIRTQL